MKKQPQGTPRTEPFPKKDLERERVIEQQEGVAAAKGGSVEASDRPEPNVPHPEDLSMMDSERTKGR